MQEINETGKVKMKILDKLTIHSQNRNIIKFIEELPSLHKEADRAFERKYNMKKVEDKNRSLFPDGTYESIQNRESEEVYIGD